MVDDRDWIEKCKIQQLIYRYSDAVTRADLHAMRSVFADDAVWESPLLDLRHESADAFCEHFRDATATTELLIQTPSSPVIDLVDDDTATATTTIFEFFRGTAAADGPFGPRGAEINYQDYGIYYDDLSQIDGEWKFTHRLFVPIYLEPGVVRGDVPIARSSLVNPLATGPVVGQFAGW
jgi:ketosteroid isomerase-like protein